nr:hypothetical protein [Pseudomonas sp.]
MRYIGRICRAGGAPVVARRLVVAVAFTGAFVLSSSVSASSEAWHAHAESVLELLQADTRRALDNVAGRAPQAAGQMESSGRAPVAPDRVAADRVAPDRLELAALYGTAGRLTAVVYVNGERKEYRPGATLPYAGKGAAGEYRLVRIVDTCVLLKRRNARQTRSACFNPASQPDAVPLHSDNRVLAAGSEAASLAMPLPAASLSQRLR